MKYVKLKKHRSTDKDLDHNAAYKQQRLYEIKEQEQEQDIEQLIEGESNDDDQENA
jgi:hypothetical protein